MKKHAIIPVFIPHVGCPNDCVFCNQKIITARQAHVTAADVVKIIETYLPTLTGRGLETIELAFFGGSFTGIPIAEQSAFLEVALRYKRRGLIDKIHLSTRPDYINHEILQNLKSYEVDIIELGVQSFDDKVLAASNRGHDSACVYEACHLIKSYGFELGIQLMIGLPGDSLEKCLYSAKEAVKIAPSIARLYPTIVLQDTALEELFREGRYHALTTDEAVDITKEMYRIIRKAGINIIRVGLKSTDLINDDSGNTLGHTYHPAFRQLVEGQLAREDLETQLTALLQKLDDGVVNFKNQAAATNTSPGKGKNLRVIFSSNGVSFSNMIGNSKRNKDYFEKKYPQLSFRFLADNSLEDMVYSASIMQIPAPILK